MMKIDNWLLSDSDYYDFLLSINRDLVLNYLQTNIWDEVITHDEEELGNWIWE